MNISDFVKIFVKTKEQFYKDKNDAKSYIKDLEKKLDDAKENFDDAKFILFVLEGYIENSKIPICYNRYVEDVLNLIRFGNLNGDNNKKSFLAYLDDIYFNYRITLASCKRFYVNKEYDKVIKTYNESMQDICKIESELKEFIKNEKLEYAYNLPSLQRIF